jgi:hypothetical protein
MLSNRRLGRIVPIQREAPSPAPQDYKRCVIESKTRYAEGAFNGAITGLEGRTGEREQGSALFGPFPPAQGKGFSDLSRAIETSRIGGAYQLKGEIAPYEKEGQGDFA